MYKNYLLVEKETNYPYIKYGHISFARYTETGAKIACSRLNKNRKLKYYVMEAKAWEMAFNPMVEKTNLLSGKKFMGRKYEPLCTDPSSETYWSM